MQRPLRQIPVPSQYESDSKHSGKGVDIGFLLAGQQAVAVYQAFRRTWFEGGYARSFGACSMVELEPHHGRASEITFPDALPVLDLERGADLVFVLYDQGAIRAQLEQSLQRLAACRSLVVMVPVGEDVFKPRVHGSSFLSLTGCGCEKPVLSYPVIIVQMLIGLMVTLLDLGIICVDFSDLTTLVMAAKQQHLVFQGEVLAADERLADALANLTAQVNICDAKGYLMVVKSGHGVRLNDVAQAGEVLQDAYPESAVGLIAMPQFYCQPGFSPAVLLYTVY
ncbi:MAG: hypothetical protein KDI30_11775 [Pseudomonadales bacterium]|nr:hypothetical protein [Pseudomonadales bacterium]